MSAELGQVPLASERKELRPYRLLCIKASGVRVEFSRYETRLEAEQIGARLAELGCSTEIEDALVG